MTDAWLEKFRLRRTAEGFTDIAGWRTYYIEIMLTTALVVFPVGVLFSLPKYLAEKKYGLIAFDFSIILVIALALRLRARISLVKFYYALIYAITMTFFIALGPTYARPGYLVLCVVTAAFLFGVRAAVIATIVNALLLQLMYQYIGPHYAAWAFVYHEPLRTWIMFIVSISLISLITSLPAGLLLYQMNRLLLHEHELGAQLALEGTALQATNAELNREIAERSKAEQALRESEEKYRALIEATGTGFVIIDREGRVLDANSEYVRLTGHEEFQEIAGKSLIEWTAPRQREWNRAAIEQCFHDGHIRNLEIDYVGPSGEIHPLEISATVVDLGGTPRILSICRDISERKKAEQERERLQNDLTQAQKMEALGTLAGGIAHDINNIMEAIICYAQLALGTPTNEEKARQRITGILKAAERAKDLVQQILAFSRKAETRTTPLEIRATVTEALKMMRALLPANIELHQQLDDTGVVLSSSTQIHQIIMNLCHNAIQAIGADGGVVDVGLTKALIDEPLAAQTLALPTGSYLKLSIRDTGHGMPPEIATRIFEPYFTTKEMGRGTGLGLSVVHGIVRSLGGAITCHSTPGEGTIFDIYFPEIASAPAIGLPQTEKTLLTGSETILYIDDEPMLTTIAGEMLEGLGYHVVTATDSHEALDIFAAHPEQFDCVITDMTMPQMTGDILARKILDLRGDMPIILCTGYNEHITREDAMAIGIREFLMKPYNRTELAQTIRRILDDTTPSA